MFLFNILILIEDLFTRDLSYCRLLSQLFFTPKNATFVQSETMASIGVFTRLASVCRYKITGSERCL